MPYVAMQTGKSLSMDKKQEIAKKMGEVISVIPGKSANNMMVQINDAQFIQFPGRPDEDCLYMQIQLHHEAKFEQKSLLIEKTAEMLSETTGIPISNIYITIREYDNWGAKGKYL